MGRGDKEEREAKKCEGEGLRKEGKEGQRREGREERNETRMS